MVLLCCTPDRRTLPSLEIFYALPIELWLNRGENGFETILQVSDVYFKGLADGDGDGDVDLLGMEYDELRDDHPVRLTWDGRDGQRQSVAAGVYLYRLQVGN